MSEEKAGQTSEERSKKRFRIPRQPAAFLAILLMEGAVAFGLLISLSYVSFQMRFSADIIRAWLLLLYVVPCLLGGLMVRRVKLRPPLPWGIGAGAAFYGGLVLLSALQEMVLPGTELLLLCLSGAVMGVFITKKRRSDKKSDGNE